MNTLKSPTASSSFTTSFIDDMSKLAVSHVRRKLGKRNYTLAKYIEPGNIIYKPTFENDVEVTDGKRRPHVVVDVEHS